MSAIKTIKTAIRQLGIEEDDERDLYQRLTGERRVSNMSPKQHVTVIDELRRLGFRPAQRRPDGRLKLSGPYAGVLQALWIAGWNLGIVRSRDDAALTTFVKGRTGIDQVRFLHHSKHANSAVEALKAWIAREGGVDWTDAAKADGYKIAWAQWRMLSQGDCASAFWCAVSDVLKRDVYGRELSKDEWITVMNAFGKRIRARKAGS